MFQLAKSDYPTYSVLLFGKIKKSETCSTQ